MARIKVVRERPDRIDRELIEYNVPDCLASIQEKKIQDIALTCLEILIDWIASIFYDAYNTLYDLKRVMYRHGCGIHGGTEQYSIHHFADGTRLYDLTDIQRVRIWRINDNGVERDAIMLLRGQEHHRVLFSQEAPDHLINFSAERGTRSVVVTDDNDGRNLDEENICMIHEYEEDLPAHSARNWTFNLHPAPVQVAHPLSQRPDEMERVYFPDERYARVYVSPAAAPLPAGAPREIPAKTRQMLKEVYGLATPPPFAPTDKSMMIFNATGRGVSYTNQAGIPTLFLDDAEGNPRPVTIGVDMDSDLYVGIVHKEQRLQLCVDNPAEDFVLVRANLSKEGALIGYHIQQPGRHEINIAYSKSRKEMSCMLLDQKPLILKTPPASVQEILNSHPLLKKQDCKGMSVRRVAASQPDVNIFYYGRRDNLKLFQFNKQIDGKTSHVLKIKSGVKNGGNISYERPERDALYPTFERGSVILISDFVNPKKPEEERYLIVQRGKPDLEIFFTGIRGIPKCRPPNLVDAPKEQSKAEKKAS